MTKVFFIFFILFINLNVAFSQRAKQYYQLISKAEKSFVKNDIQMSMIYYDSAFTKFDYPFYRNIRQAAIIGSFSDDQNRYHKFLKKCVQRGMTINELKFFIDRTPNDKFVYQLYSDYDKYRNTFLKSIDTFSLFNYLETDMLEQVAMEKGNDSIFFHNMMSMTAKMYMELVDSIGFPDEKRLGLCYFTFISKSNKMDPNANWYKIKLKYHKKKANLGYSLYGSIRVEDLMDKPYSMKPGNWFVSHYHIENYIIDTVFYDYLLRGMYDLKIHPITLALFLERTGLKEYEFLMTYYSPLYLKLKMKLKKALNIDDAKKKMINNNRKMLFVRSIDMERKIINEFYRLKYGKSPKKLNKKTFRKIQYEINSFMKYI